jgi:hypothetical protein
MSTSRPARLHGCRNDSSVLLRYGAPGRLLERSWKLRMETKVPTTACRETTPSSHLPEAKEAIAWLISWSSRNLPCSVSSLQSSAQSLECLECICGNELTSTTSQSMLYEITAVTQCVCYRSHADILHTCMLLTLLRGRMPLAYLLQEWPCLPG